MALTAASMKSAIVSQLNSLVKPKYINVGDDHELSGYTYDDYTDAFAQALANAIVTEITTKAQAVGTDAPTGDSHALAIV